MNQEIEEVLEPYWSDNAVWRFAEIGSGWNQIVIDLVVDLVAAYPNFKVVQVKEKFGGLRFYVENVTLDYSGQPLAESFFSERIREAEELSFATCDVCGAKGSSEGSQGWVMTRCKTHEGGQQGW